MKKVLSLFLATLICASVIVPTLAYDQNENTIVQMESVGHGEFRLTNTSIYGDIVEIENVEEGNVILAEPTTDDDILKVSSNKYLVKAYDDTYLLTDKISINLNDFGENENTLKQYAISEESVEEMQEVIACQKAMGNNEFYIEIYAPSAIDSGSETTRGTTTYNYYTYTDNMGFRWDMKDTNIKYANLSSPMIQSQGDDTKEITSAFTNLVISAAGTANKYVSVFGVGKSLYDLHVAIRGEVVQSTGGDKTYSSAVFDRVEKTSEFYSAGLGGYLIGKKSHKVWMNRLDTYQFYGYNGSAGLLQPSVNAEHYSKYWNDNEMTIARYGPEDYLTTMLYDTKIILNGIN